jgi:hypothetical protein
MNSLAVALMYRATTVPIPTVRKRNPDIKSVVFLFAPNLYYARVSLVAIK